MTETQAETGQSANGAAPIPDVVADVADVAAAVVGPTERVMFAIMLIAGAGLLFLAVDGLSGYGLTRALFPSRGDTAEDG
jgi:hypothetical protein